MPAEERPRFARDFPPHAELDALVKAFERGDYARVRVEGRRLAGSCESDEVRRAASSLVERTQPDPLAVYLLALATGLLVALSAYWVTHASRPRGASRPPPVSGTAGPPRHLQAPAPNSALPRR